MDLELEKLREACRWDFNLIPKYMRTYERAYGKQLQLYPLLGASCSLHSGCNYPQGIPYYLPEDPEEHEWKIEPSFWGIQEDLINWMGIPYNLFNTKKNILPHSVSSDQLLEAFYSRISQYFGYEHVQDLIKYYFEYQLKDIITIIAELEIPPKMVYYPLTPISLEETIKLINLRIDLIERRLYPGYSEHDRSRDDTDTNDWLSRNHLSFCLDNHHPLTIFSFTSIGGIAEYQESHNVSSLWITNHRRGVTFRSPFWRHNKEEVAKAEFSIFG